MAKRDLCYTHHCSEFDKLPNAMRHLAAEWRTVKPGECEICQEELRQARATIVKVERSE